MKRQPESSNFFEQPPPNFTEESLAELKIRKKGYGEKIERGKEQESQPEPPYPPFNDEAFLIYQDDLRKKAAESGKSLMHVTQEQALKDNQEWEKRRSQEFKENQEMLMVVKEAMDTKQRLMAEGKTEEANKIRIVLVLTGGGLKVSRTMAQIEALIKMGYKDVFTVIYGSSTGTMAAGAFAGNAERAKEIADMFFEKHLSPDFINFKRPKKIVNIGYVEKLLEQGGTGAAFDIQGIQDNPAKLYFQLTDIETEQAILVDMQEYIKQGGDPARIAAKSMSLPGFAGRSPTYEGKKVTDGGLVPVPIEEIKRRFNPTHILIIPQDPFEQTSKSLATRAGKAAALFITRFLPIPVVGKGMLAKGILKMRHMEDLAAEYIKNSDIPIAFSYPPKDELTTLNKKADARKTRHETFDSTCRAFGHPELVKDYRVGK